MVWCSAVERGIVGCCENCRVLVRSGGGDGLIVGLRVEYKGGL